MTTLIRPLAALPPALHRDEILRALEVHHGRKDLAASALGVSARTVLNKLRRYGLADEWIRVKRRVER